MAYNNAIPQATDRLKDSQSDLLGNFQAIKTLIDINHVTFDTPDQGKHKSVMMPDQAGGLPVFGAGECGFFAATPIAPQPLTGVNELFVHRSDGSETLMTAGDLQALDFPLSGWTFLPSGLLIKWGVEQMGSIIPGGIGLAIAVYPVGANIPVFTNIYNTLITLIPLAPPVGFITSFVNLAVTNPTQVGFSVRNLDVNPSPIYNIMWVTTGI